MGSSPSYEVHNDSLQQPALRPKRASHPGKDSVRSTKNRPLIVREEANPEQENQHLSSSPQEQQPLSQHGTPSQKDQLHIQTNARQAVQQQILFQQPPESIYADVPLPNKQHLEAQNADDSMQPDPREMHHHRQNRKRHTGTDQLEQIEGELHGRPKIRHYVKTNTHQHPSHLDDTSPINHSLALPIPHRKSPQLDYKQFDSAHIRHKAMQEIDQAEHYPHHQRAIIAREPIYEHERLYPKILKNNHREPQDHSAIPNHNRHYQHQRNIQEEAYEQPHKLQLYKRHIFRAHPDEHDVKELQRSLEVRSHPEEDLRGSLGQVHPKAALDTQRRLKGKSLPKNEEIPVQANFRKRKASMPADIDQAQLRASSKWQQLEQKSIADINKEKQFNISEYQVDPTELKTCHAGCGRKFASDRIARHEAVCKLAQQRRDVFNAQDHRIVSKQQRKFLKRNRGGVQHQATTHSHKKGIPKWKAQSIALRAHIKLGLDLHYSPTAEQQEMLNQEHHIDIVACPVCQRNFNKNAAKTHIPFCKAQLEKQLERERFEKPKTKR